MSLTNTLWLADPTGLYDVLDVTFQWAVRWNPICAFPFDFRGHQEFQPLLSGCPFYV